MKLVERVLDQIIRRKAHKDQMQFVFLAEVPLKPYSLFESMKKKELMQTGFSTVFSWITRNLSAVYPDRCCWPFEASVSKNGQCGLSRLCTVLPGVAFQKTVRSVKKIKTVVGLHQGVLLSPLLFLVLEVLSQQINHRKGVSLELRYADELVTLADTLDDCITRLRILDRREKTYEST